MFKFMLALAFLVAATNGKTYLIETKDSDHRGGSKSNDYFGDTISEAQSNAVNMEGSGNMACSQMKCSFNNGGDYSQTNINQMQQCCGNVIINN